MDKWEVAQKIEKIILSGNKGFTNPYLDLAEWHLKEVAKAKEEREKKG